MYAQVLSCPALDAATRRDLAHRLFHLGALDFSGVRLKTGEITPVYFDIRLSISDPVMLQDLARCMHKMIAHATQDKFDIIAGVPAAAVPLATVMSIQNNLKMILTRKAAKDYGTKKVIEGVWQPGQNVLVVEDVVTYGDSIASTTAVCCDILLISPLSPFFLASTIQRAASETRGSCGGASTGRLAEPPGESQCPIASVGVSTPF